MMDRRPDQVRVRDLLMSSKPADAFQRFRYRHRVRPELMIGKIQVGFQESNSVLRRQRIRRKSRIRNDSHERGLRERTRRPTGLRLPREPLSYSIMEFVARPRQCDQDIRIQQKRSHLDFVLK